MGDVKVVLGGDLDVDGLVAALRAAEGSADGRHVYPMWVEVGKVVVHEGASGVVGEFRTLVERDVDVVERVVRSRDGAWSVEILEKA